RPLHDLPSFPTRRSSDLEDRRVCAYTQCQSKHYDSREAGGLAQRASAKAHVAPQCIHYGFPTARANDFLADFEASTLQADCAKGFLAAHPVLHLLFGGHLLIGAKLIIQLPVDLFLSEQ